MKKGQASYFYITLLVFLLTITPAIAYEKKDTSYASPTLTILPLLRLSCALPKPHNIIFIHPFKVGGTSVISAIQAIPFIKHKRAGVPRTSGISPGLITNGWQGGLSPIKKAPQDYVGHTFLSGHFPYGAHNYLNDKYHYITLIRNPLERELSSVNFDYQRGYINSKEEALHYLLHTMIDNPQTRMIAGEEYFEGKCTKDILEKAKTNLDHFALVGITEDTDLFIQALLSLLETQAIAMPKIQVTGQKIIEPTKDILKQLEEKHQYDLELYYYAKKIWETWKENHIQGVVPFGKESQILTILPDFLHTRTTTYWTVSQIENYNLLHLQNKLVQTEQVHQGIPIQKND